MVANGDSTASKAELEGIRRRQKRTKPRLASPAHTCKAAPHLAQQRGGGQAAKGVATVRLVPGLAADASLVRLRAGGRVEETKNVLY